MKFRFIVSEALRSVRASLSTTMAATMTVLIGMFLVGLLLAFGTWARSWSNHTKNGLLVKVFFCTDVSCGKEATTKQINAVASKLQANPQVKKVTFVSKQEALARMRKQEPELVQNIASNPLPASEEVEPIKGDYVSSIDRSLHPLPAGVEKTTYGKKTASRILRVARVIETIFGIAIIVLLVASTLLIANTIRLSIFARRREIEVMKLVGATNWFVRGPFMLEGLICGLIGSVAAVFLLLLGKEIALPSILGHINAGSDVHGISFSLNALVLVAVGLLLGVAGSALTMRRFLRV